MNFSTLLRMMRFWPPFWGAGISVKSFKRDGTQIIVQMKMRFWNKNYVGTHYGGSMYSMTDPFYMLMLMNLLGKGYIVWDKSASIRYKIPAKGTIYARFELSHEQVEKIRLEVNEAKKIESEFLIPITDEEGKVVAEVKKILTIIKK
ncbi:DUF4442 domain-containing protein [Fluoribacter dumoffii]|uniref:Tetrameric acyl-CoA thioesterase n=1 Tax=Fluoribacter dumoffii TaxID=463 RepID=A0A377GCC6_9GAMM|nr:DUF4442 domain-containing protein [Fluoribacter dumoffii]KTC90673.1 hypothetical protein Ldum_1741 [Fluoribacter dumoffii NY 23]MCW8386353.1 DUF4442 domain-containing protein [Fluoribacter dumoffii]MCW8419406.1 DUF4442 domain-containing protein [Fluoribacter dumoffii]MCW8452719.1 DUF4442 domain-containing protein [Fluoribacter dumoffii]MCW8460031.1 DUF4442 domain-containing protein [Fluoribacter dumoffii]